MPIRPRDTFGKEFAARCSHGVAVRGATAEYERRGRGVLQVDHTQPFKHIHAAGSRLVVDQQRRGSSLGLRLIPWVITRPRVSVPVEIDTQADQSLDSVLWKRRGCGMSAAFGAVVPVGHVFLCPSPAPSPPATPLVGVVPALVRNGIAPAREPRGRAPVAG